MPNRLIHETSPYLLQHAHNPVDWHPWSDAALAEAQKLDKPILLSIGYSACHWCHVMEHESFENETIARVMNEYFVNIKVDREERPDLDQIYMNAVQIMTGSGGWPLTVFLLPTGEPFYGGTYFPPDERYGRPGFLRLLHGIAEAYRERRQDVVESAQSLRQHLNPSIRSNDAHDAAALDAGMLDAAVQSLLPAFDSSDGGFGGAPKFPPAMTIDFLLRYHYRSGDSQALHMATFTLDRMAYGGMYDQVGGGFHRYSTDARWLVPHFEKMLYDNALLARAYLDAYRLTRNPLYRRITEEILDFVLREMRAPNGGFYSSQDADSEGVEGRFYVWDRREFEDAAEDDGLLARYFDVSEHGNWEQRNILNVPTEPAAFAEREGVSAAELDARIRAARPGLYAAREQRVRPGRDEKILTDWNGMMLRAFAEAAAGLGRDDYRAAAEANAAFLSDALWDGRRMLHCYKDGRARFNGYLDDYANAADGLLALYQLTFDERWLDLAETLADRIVELFADDRQGGFYFTASDHEALVARTRDPFDNATPSGNSVSADVLMRLGTIMGRDDLRRRGEGVIDTVAGLMPQHPSAFGRLLAALDYRIGPSCEVALVGGTEPFASAFRSHYLPRAVIAAGPDSRSALLRDRPAVDGRPTAYVCENLTCKLPITDVEEFDRELRRR